MSGILPIIYLIVSLLQFIILLRFICQAMNVNYYNPVTQSIVKISGYIIKPFEILNLHSSATFLFLILYIFTLGKFYLPMLATFESFSVISFMLIALGYLIKDLTNIFFYLIIISAIKSWFNVFVSHPIFSLIDELCEPLYSYVRSVIPPISGIDFSPIAILFILQIIERFLIPQIMNLGYLV
tara:strand:+ start:2326 stop:2874 length:549 start_codon:yes stop_codon:yes gene_type:complete